jgi:hypothetical protein
MRKLALIALVLMAVGFGAMLLGLLIGITPLYIDSSGMHRRVLQPELEEFTTNYSKTADVSLAFASDDITIVRGDRFGYTVTGSYSQKLSTELTADRLVIKQENQHAWLDFGWDGMVMFGQGSWRGAQVTVYIPEDMTVSTFDVNVASGDLTIDSVAVESMIVNGASGDFSANNMVADRIDMNIISGNIRMDSIDAGVFNLSGASGDVTATNLVVERAMSVNLLSGDVRISGDLRGDIELRGASGSIDIELIGASSDYSWTIDATSGNIWISDAYGDLPTHSRGPAPELELEDPATPPTPPGAEPAPPVPAEPLEPTPDIAPAAPTSGADRITITVLSGDIAIRFLR